MRASTPATVAPSCFDGFLDREGMAGKTGFLQTGGRLALDRTGQGDVALGSGGGSRTGRKTTRSLLMAGGGVITGFLCYLYASRAVSTRAELEYRLTVNDETAAEGSTSFPAPAEGKTEERTIPLPDTDVRAGDLVSVLDQIPHWLDRRPQGGQRQWGPGRDPSGPLRCGGDGDHDGKGLPPPAGGPGGHGLGAAQGGRWWPSPLKGAPGPSP